MKFVAFAVLILANYANAVVVPPAPQMSSECETYIKKAQLPQTDAQITEFPSEALSFSLRPKPTEPEPPRPLIQQKDLPKEKQPFWRTKPGLTEKMERERQVLTSVTRKNIKGGDIKFDIKVAGHVSAPRDFSFKTAQNYPRLKEVSDNFKTVIYRPQENRLYLILTALGYQERMILDVHPASGDGRDEIQFEVVWGNFKGMKGFIGFESLSLAKTEMSMIATYQSRTLPLPKILMGLAFEAVTQKVAEKLRSFVEADYKLALKCGAL